MIEEAEDFHKRHGGDKRCVRENGFAYYSDGARLEMRWNMQYEPPTDPVELQRAIVTYRQIKLGEVESKYKSIYVRLSEHIKAGQNPQNVGLQPPSEQEKLELEKLKERVLKQRRMLQTERDKLEKIDPREKIIRQREKEAAAQSRQFDEVSSWLNNNRI